VKPGKPNSRQDFIRILLPMSKNRLFSTKGPSTPLYDLVSDSVSDLLENQMSIQFCHRFFVS
jgi:hypothetical protein